MTKEWYPRLVVQRACHARPVGGRSLPRLRDFRTLVTVCRSYSVNFRLHVQRYHAIHIDIRYGDTRVLPIDENILFHI